jgi:hypothetical protein
VLMRVVLGFGILLLISGAEFLAIVCLLLLWPFCAYYLCFVSSLLSGRFLVNEIKKVLLLLLVFNPFLMILSLLW